MRHQADSPSPTVALLPLLVQVSYGTASTLLWGNLNLQLTKLLHDIQIIISIVSVILEEKLMNIHIHMRQYRTPPLVVV